MKSVVRLRHAEPSSEGAWVGRVFIDNRGPVAVRVPDAGLAAIRRSTGKDPTLAGVAKMYREWLNASFSLYPDFWRGVLNSKVTTFVCSCTRKRCHGKVLLGFLKEHGACLQKT